MGGENVKDKPFGFGVEREYGCRRAGHNDATRRQHSDLKLTFNM